MGGNAPAALSPSGGGHSTGWYLVRILPALLGGLLAIALAIGIAICCMVPPPPHLSPFPGGHLSKEVERMTLPRWMAASSQDVLNPL